MFRNIFNEYAKCLGYGDYDTKTDACTSDGAAGCWNTPSREGRIKHENNRIHSYFSDRCGYWSFFEKDGTYKTHNVSC